MKTNTRRLIEVLVIGTIILLIFALNFGCISNVKYFPKNTYMESVDKKYMQPIVKADF